MRKSLPAFLTLLLGLTTAPAFAQFDQPIVDAKLNVQRVRPIADQYIVVLKDTADARGVAARHGAAPGFVYSTLINGFSAKLNRTQLRRLLRDNDVKYVDQDGMVQAYQATPGSFAVSSGGEINPLAVQPGATWGIDKLDQQWGAGTDGSYNYTNTGKGVNVYVVDTGIYTAHNEFDGAASNRAKAGAAGFDAFGGNGQDCNGHGTHVAGTIGGTRYGVAKAVKLYSVRVLDCSGNGTWAGFIAGAEWVTANHAKPAVANASLGGGFVQAANDAVEKSISWGVTWVLAAGNSNVNACTTSPASAPSAITVGATDINNAKAGFSNFGPCVDIHAPGVSITSSWIGGVNATNTINGTSMASPHVAGLAALYLQTVNNAAPGQVLDGVRDSGVRNVVTGLPAATVNLLAHKINSTHTGTNQLPGANCTTQEPDVFSGQCYYWSPNDSYHHVWLRGQPGANFNVKFYQWSTVSNSWVLKATKATSNTNEYLKYFGAGGFWYMFLVESTGGAGQYDAWVINQGMRAQP
jgi:subtilisin family serine protease